MEVNTLGKIRRLYIPPIYILRFNIVVILIYMGRVENSIFSGLRTSKVLLQPQEILESPSGI